jgi:tetratricopeptide (TPR) repeat protein
MRLTPWLLVVVGLVLSGCSQANKKVSEEEKQAQMVAVGFVQAGRSYSAWGNEDAAIRSYSRALQLCRDPEISLAAYRDRGQSYLAREDYVRAIDDYSKSLDLGAKMKPPFLADYVGRAWAYHLSGDDGKAFADFEAGIAADPKMQMVYLYRGVCQWTRGLADDAIADFLKATAVDKDAAVKSALYAWFLLQRAGRKEEAEKLLAPYLKKSPGKSYSDDLVLYVGGKIPEEVLRARIMATPSEEMQRWQMCELGFWAGMLALLKGDRAKSEAELAAAVKVGMKIQTDYQVSVYELGQLRKSVAGK